MHIAKCSPELLHEDVLLAADERLARSRGAGGPETTPSPARSRPRPRGLRSGDAAHAHAFAAVAAVRARQLEDAVCRLRYAEGRSEVATAAALGLPVARVPALVRRASRRLELRADVGTPPLDVLYEDDDLVAVAKPPGLRTTPVHRWQGGSLVNRLIGHLGAPPLPVHRLDMDTSGVVVMVKHRAAATAIQRQFEARETRKVRCVGVGAGVHVVVCVCACVCGWVGVLT